MGAGYVGLISAVTLTREGNHVTAIDSSPDLVEMIQRGVPPFFEPKLEERLKNALSLGLKVVNNLPDEDFDVYLVTVGTPTVDGIQDLGQIRHALTSITNHLKNRNNYAVIVVKSTVAPGTTDSLKEITGKILASDRFDFCMNPEFLREGSAVEDAEFPDRIVLGSSSDRAIEVLQEMYQSSECSKFVVSPSTAEMIKYVNNSLLACLISFSNEMSNIAAINPNINFMEVLRITLSDKRWQERSEGESLPSVTSYLKPGPGYGGSCFPKDVQALTSYAQAQGVSVPMLEAIQKVNREQAVIVLKPLVAKILKGEIKKVLVLGLSFKENTSDVRGSVSLPIIQHLLNVGAEVRFHDPVASVVFCRENSFSQDMIFSDLRSGLDWSQAAVIATPWSDYKFLSEANNYDGFLLDTRKFLTR